MVDIGKDIDIDKIVDNMNVNELRWIVRVQRKFLARDALDEADIGKAPSSDCMRYISVVLAEAALASITG